MKKVLCIVLSLVMLLSMSVPAFAVELDTSENSNAGLTTQDLYQRATEIANARGITLMPYEQAMASSVGSADSRVDKEISYEYPGKNVLDATKSAVKNENTIQAEIRGGSSQSNAQTISVPSYTYDSIATAGEEDWFKFEVNGNGAHNLYTTGSTDTKVEFYKRTWYGSYKLIDSNDDGGEGLNFRLELGLEMNVDYYVKVTAYGDKTGSYTLRIEENRDSLYAPNGGSWSWDVANPDPDGVYFNVDKIVYLPPTEAQGYYIMVSQDSIREIRDYVLGLSYNAAVAYLMSYFGITHAVASFMLGELASFAFPSLTDMELDSIAEAGGMRSDGTFSNGIVIYSLTSYTVDLYPVTMNTYESWTSSYMYGESRYRGTFDETDKTPMWR